MRPFTHNVVIRPTTLQVNLPNEQKAIIQQLYAAIASDEGRNEQLFNDVLLALEAKRSPLILTERKDHAAILAEKLSKVCKTVIVMVGGQSGRQRAEVQQRLLTIPENEERLLIATGRYIGEGFDDARNRTIKEATLNATITKPASSWPSISNSSSTYDHARRLKTSRA